MPIHLILHSFPFNLFEVSFENVNYHFECSSFHHSSPDRFATSYSDVDDALKGESVGVEEVSSFEGRREVKIRGKGSLRQRRQERQQGLGGISAL